MTINTLQQLSQLTSTKISINIYSYKTRDVHKQKSYKCYIVIIISEFQFTICFVSQSIRYPWPITSPWWKIHRIIPIFKSGDRSQVNKLNYSTVQLQLHITTRYHACQRVHHAKSFRLPRRGTRPRPRPT